MRKDEEKQRQFEEEQRKEQRFEQEEIRRRDKREEIKLQMQRRYREEMWTQLHLSKKVLEGRSYQIGKHQI